MPDLDAKTWGLLAVALVTGGALALWLKPKIKPCGCEGGEE